MRSKPRTILRRDPWMSRAEWRGILLYRRLYLQAFEDARIPLDIIVATLIKDYLAQLILTRRAQRDLTESESPDAPLPAPPAVLIDRVHKEEDRLKKAFTELRSLLPKPTCNPEAFAATHPTNSPRTMEAAIPLSSIPKSEIKKPHSYEFVGPKFPNYPSPELGPFYEPDTPGGVFYTPAPGSPQARAYQLKKSIASRAAKACGPVSGLCSDPVSDPATPPDYNFPLPPTPESDPVPDAMTPNNPHSPDPSSIPQSKIPNVSPVARPGAKGDPQSPVSSSNPKSKIANPKSFGPPGYDPSHRPPPPSMQPAPNTFVAILPWPGG